MNIYDLWALRASFAIYTYYRTLKYAQILRKMCPRLQREEEIRQILPRMLCDERRTRKLWRAETRINHSVGDSLKCKFPNLLFTACSCRWPPTELSGPHVHRSPTTTAGPWPWATRRGPCSANKPATLTTAGPRSRAARRGPCLVDRPTTPATARLQPRATSAGAGSKRCPVDRPAGPRSWATPAGARSARFAHSSLRPPFRIWWGQCFGAWHRG